LSNAQVALDSYPGFKLGGCTFGKPSKNDFGYIKVNYKGKGTRLHRAVWMDNFGVIPEGMVVDHACHTEAMLNGLCKGGATCIHRSCINPAHLQLITFAENVRDGRSSFKNRTHCLKDLHELTPDNIGKQPAGNYCKACQKENTRKAMRTFRAKKKAAK
jgi:hypothetical protein